MRSTGGGCRNCSGLSEAPFSSEAGLACENVNKAASVPTKHCHPLGTPKSCSPHLQFLPGQLQCTMLDFLFLFFETESCFVARLECSDAILAHCNL